MYKQIFLVFILFLTFSNTNAQTCIGGSSTSNMPTKCFEIESILVDACDGSNEGRNEMVRLRIGPNPIAVSSIGVAPYASTPNQTVNWGSGAPGGASGNIFRGFSNITTIPSILAKIVTINAIIAAAGNCGKLIPLNANGTIPAGVNLLLITSTDFNPTAQDFSSLSDTLYVIIQVAGNTGGHFANQGSSGTRKLILYSGTCGDTVTYTPSSLIKQDQTVGAEDGGAVNYNYAGIPTYVNYGCAVPVIPFSCDAGTTNPTYCNGVSVNLAGTVTGSNCYVWRASNSATGTFADSTNLLTTFTINSGYVGPVKLYLYTKSNCSTKIDSVMFNSIASSGVLNAGNDTSMCNSIAFHVNATTTATGTYAWTKSGSGTFDQTNILNPTYTPSLLDIGIVNLIITQTTSCGVLKDTVKVTYTSKANANFTLSDSNFCYNNLPININVNPTVSGGVFLSNTGIFIGNVFTFDAAGSFFIKYKVGAGSCSDSLTKPIIASTPSNPNFSLSDTLVCKNSPFVILTPTQAGGVFSGVRVLVNKFAPDTVGIFTLKYKISNGLCVDSLSKNITVKPRPDATFTTTDSVFCVNDPKAIFTPIEAGGVYTGTNVLGNQYNPITVGSFIVKYLISNGTCSDSSFKTMLVYPKPTANFTFIPANPYINDTVYFTFTGSNATKYYWSFGDLKNSSSNLKDPLFEFIDVNVYRTWLKVSNNEGCSDSIFKDITVLKKETIFIPNVFTPQNTDGLGLNDYFTIRSYGINNYHMQIYNRWGSLLYETNNINPGWDGTYDGDTCPEGVYFYIIDAIGISTKTYHLHGTVSLLR